jgi:hypothetical protein
MRFRACSLSSSVGKCYLDNLRPDGATRRKWRQLVGKVREWVYGKPTPPRL